MPPSTSMTESGTSAGRLCRKALPVLACLVVGLAACSSETSDRDQAVDALERANGAAGLETEMAALVSDIPPAPTPKDQVKVNTTVADLDNQAETLLASADTGQTYDEKITASVEQTRGAGQELASAGPSSAAVGKARKVAVGRLGKSNENLGQATKLIGTDLADENGQLSEEDAAALKKTVNTVDESGQAVEAAGKKVASAGPCTVSAPVSGRLPVKTTKGSVGCEEATKVFDTYYNDPSVVFEGSGGTATIGEWFCISSSAGAVSDGLTDHFTTCMRERDGAEIQTLVPKS